MISCGEAVRQLWDYLEGAIEEHDRRKIEEHLAFCRRCCSAAEFAEELRRFLTTHAADEVPAEVRARLTATLERF